MKKNNLLFPILCVSALLMTSCGYREPKEDTEDKLPTFVGLPIDPNDDIEHVNKIEDVKLSLDPTLFDCKKYNKIAHNGNKLTTITAVPIDTDNKTIDDNIKYVTKQVNKLGYDLDKIDLTYITPSEMIFDNINYFNELKKERNNFPNGKNI